MAKSNDIEQRVEEIMDNIASDKVSQAIKLLLDFSDDFPHDREAKTSATIISQNFHSLEKEKINGTLSFSELTLETNKILRRICQLIESIKNSLIQNMAA